MELSQILLYSMLAIMAAFYIRRSFLSRSLHNYTGSEAQQRVQAGSILLDVRTAGERRSLSIPSSLHIPVHQISARVKELEKYREKEIICYCASGNRSVSAAITLKKAGFTVGNLTGGISSWNFSKN